jgi:DUF971 family protein
VAATVTDIEVDRERAVTVTFDDGSVCTFGLADLRVNCPCAECRGKRDRGTSPWTAGSSPLTIVDAELVGAWAISFVWSDGHATGIYPWDALRRWCDEGAGEIEAPD